MLIRNPKIVIKIFKKEGKKTCILKNYLVVRGDLTHNIKWREKQYLIRIIIIIIKNNEEQKTLITVYM